MLICLRRITDEASKYGICKIVPPAAWKPKCAINMINPKKFPTKLQKVNSLREGTGFDDGKVYNIADFKSMADTFKKKWCEKYYEGNAATQEQLAKDYWGMVETNNKEAEVSYGNDLDTSTFGSGFVRCSKQKIVTDNMDEYVRYSYDEASDETVAEFTEEFYKSSGWNINNLPTEDQSILKHLQAAVNGVNVPWLYIGMLFSTFCWHNEDNYFNSVNYSHFGDVKQWYGIPGNAAQLMEKVIQYHWCGY